MKYIKYFENIDQKTWIETTKEDYNKESINIKKSEIDYLRDYFEQYRKKIRVRYSRNSISISGLKKGVTIYKQDDDYFVLAVTDKGAVRCWSGWYQPEKYYKCDQIFGLIDFLEYDLLKRLSKKEDNIDLKSEVRKMISKLNNDQVEKVKKFIEKI